VQGPLGKVSSLKVPDSQKELFFKNLNILFNSFGSRFTCANTFIVNDSLSKHILNKSKNVVLSESWFYIGKWYLRHVFPYESCVLESMIASESQLRIDFIPNK